LVTLAITVIVVLLAIYHRRRQQQKVRSMMLEETQCTTVGEAQPTVTEETQPILSNETRQTVTQDTQPTGLEDFKSAEVPEERATSQQETLLTSIAGTKYIVEDQVLPTEIQELQSMAEEVQRIVAEGTEITAPEEIELTVGHEAESQTAEKLSQEREKRQRKPEERGGRPRGTARNHTEGPLQEAKRSLESPEIVCWKKERQWMAAVEIPEELVEKPGLAVLQDESPLTQEESKEARWRLERLFGKVVVQWNEGDGMQETRIALGQDGYLLFKLSGENQNQGRRVKFLSSGSYLALVPDDWERDDTLSGPPPVTPECTSLPGYQAHFFELEKGGERKIAFRKPTGEIFEIKSKAQQFELVGNRLCDATEKIGPLFGMRPPQIRAPDDQTWKDVGTIVVGEEGGRKGRWRMAISPKQGLVEQVLPPEVEARKSGWYFLRFYDTNDDLIESLDFRFICALGEIKVPQLPPLPAGNGHGPVLVEFLHEPGCAVQPADGLAKIQVERQDEKTTLIIPPDPICDETRWLVGPQGGPQVEVTILVERLWWGIGEEHNAPSEWKDQPLTLSREDFAATSKKALWLRLPRRRWVDKVLVGFEQPKARPYKVKVTDKAIAVPLREFSDSKEVEDRTQERSLKAWIERQGRFMEGVVAVIPSSQLVVAPVPVQVASPATPHWVGFGRKKTAVAKAVLQNGPGEIKINGQPIDRYFGGAPLKAKRFLQRLLELDQIRAALSPMEALITVRGSSPTTTRQAKAVAHALARALMSYDPKLIPSLKQAGFGGVRVKKRPVCSGRGN
jgi:small subunit ribosomal protein S9